MLRVVQGIRTDSQSLWTGVQAAVAVFLIGSWIFEWRSRRKASHDNPELPMMNPGDSDSDEENENHLRSLVLLLDAPRDVSGKAWIRHLGEALQVELTSDKPDAVNFVIRMPHPMLQSDGDSCFMLQIPQGSFWIFHVPKPYPDDVEEWAEGVADRRVREAVEAHRAWLSVDLAYWRDGEHDTNRIYDVIGKAAAALAGPDVLAIVCPKLMRANEFDPLLLPQVSGGDPLAIFEGPTFAPMLHSRPDDEQMEAAVAEARRRWPEFVSQFERRDPGSDQPFIIKAPFGNGDDEEFMWVIVSALEGDLIHGTLANSPHRLTDHYEGQNVTVNLARLIDWLCIDDAEEPVGGWTQKVLGAEAKWRR